MLSRLKPAPSPRPISLLGREHRQDLVTRLELDIPYNLFSLSWLEHYGVVPGRSGSFHFRAAWDERGAISAVALVIAGRLALIDACACDDACALGALYRAQHYALHHIVAPACAADHFWRGYATGRAWQPRARLISPQQMYVLSRDSWARDNPEPQKPQTGLRQATMSDLEPLFLASAMMHREETREDPLVQNPEGFRQQVRQRVELGRSFVWFDEAGRLMFKVDISSQSRYGVQLSGVFTQPMYRGRGVASRAMQALCHHLFLRGWPRITLYVNEENHAAMRVYTRAGFAPHGDYKTIFIAR